MESIGLILTIISGVNIFTLGAVLLNNYRVGKIEGTLKNGGYITCPFYKKRVDNAANKIGTQSNGKNS